MCGHKMVLQAESVPLRVSSAVELYTKDIVSARRLGGV